MKVRRALMVPSVLLASGCAYRPWTPAVSVAYWAPAPEVGQVDLPAREDALRRWQLPPSDPWASYAKYTLLSALDAAPQHVELPEVRSLYEVQDAAAAGLVVGSNGIPADTMFVVDMRGAASIAFGVALSRAARQPVSLVPTFINWPGEDELIPAEETLAALATMTPRLPDESAALSTPVFLLDSWRLAYRFDEPADDSYDNRYILTPSDLPDIATLRARGIQRVVYVVGSLDETSLEEDDVHATFFDWERGGIPIAMVDVNRLERPIALDRWQELFADDELIVEQRVTLLDEPGFYVRARGGFGGLYARPSPIFAGGGWTGRGGYGSHGGGWGHGGGGWGHGGGG
jgi:hypothetical protein